MTFASSTSNGCDSRTRAISRHRTAPWLILTDSIKKKCKLFVCSKIIQRARSIKTGSSSSPYIPCCLQDPRPLLSAICYRSTRCGFLWVHSAAAPSHDIRRSINQAQRITVAWHQNRIREQRFLGGRVLVQVCFLSAAVLTSAIAVIRSTGDFGESGQGRNKI